MHSISGTRRRVWFFASLSAMVQCLSLTTNNISRLISRKTISRTACSHREVSADPVACAAARWKGEARGSGTFFLESKIRNRTLALVLQLKKRRQSPGGIGRLTLEQLLVRFSSIW